jgi:hypothetical protein
VDGPLLVSAELRWFWKDAVPPEIERWFRSGDYPPGGGTPRVDEYLVDHDQTELGVKKRGGGKGVELKGLVSLGRQATSPFDGRVQIWTKWNLDALTIDHLPRASITKTRWLRKFDTSGRDVAEVQLDASERPVGPESRPLVRGCQFELVTLAVDDEKASWRSVGFEAFGEVGTIEDSLDRTLAHLRPGAPDFAGGLSLSYPEWLARYVV